MPEPADHERARRILALPTATETDEDGEEPHPLDTDQPSLADASPRYIRELARTYTHEALETLHAIMTSPNATDTAKIACANSLLQRGWGSPGSEAELLKVWLEAQERAEAALAATRTPAEIEPIIFRMPMTVDGNTDPKETQDH